jgi:hypothetical protein
MPAFGKRPRLCQQQGLTPFLILTPFLTFGFVLNRLDLNATQNYHQYYYYSHDYYYQHAIEST